MRHALIRHPGSPGLDLGIEASVERGASGRLRLAYRMAGEVDAVRLPPSRRPERTDGLWRTTCFEAFVADAAGRYTEVNVAPSTQWAAYGFDAYRSGMSPAEVGAPRVAAERGRAIVEVWIELNLGGALAAKAWRIGLSAVIEDRAGVISYWALAHPGEKPDFHHPDSFVIELPPP